MPIWLWILLGGGALWLWSKSQQTAAAPVLLSGGTTGGGSPAAGSQFQVGEAVNIAAGAQLYSDQALTQSVAQWPGGTAKITSIDPNGAWVGFTPMGTGLTALYVTPAVVGTVSTPSTLST
jgi:hypothetical protein